MSTFIQLIDRLDMIVESIIDDESGADALDELFMMHEHERDGEKCAIIYDATQKAMKKYCNAPVQKAIA